MTIEGVKVVVDVSAFEFWCSERSDIRVLLLVAETRDRHETNGLHVTTAFETVGNLVEFVIIPDVGVTTEESNGGIPVRATNSFEDCIRLMGIRDGDMSGNNEKVDVLVLNGFFEPLLFDRVFYALHHGVVRIALEVEEKTECHDSDALILGGELPVSLSKRLQLSSFGIVDVQVGSDVCIFVVRYSVVKLIVG